MDTALRPEQLQMARRVVGLTQQQAADRLRISQAYLALLEAGRRPVTARLANRFAKLYGLGPVALPRSSDGLGAWTSSALAAGLAGLGYPGFRQLAGKPAHNPASVLLAAITSNDVEVRVLEALPWLVVEYHNLDWDWLIREAKTRDAQNRLGFLVTLARQVAEARANQPAAERLCEIEGVLDRARLVREDTLCQDSLSDAERRWLRRTRPKEAEHWNLLTDLNAGHLPYAA
jgi:transcriptional regulator with XRE-family HTH domain